MLLPFDHHEGRIASSPRSSSSMVHVSEGEYRVLQITGSSIVLSRVSDNSLLAGNLDDPNFTENFHALIQEPTTTCPLCRQAVAVRRASFMAERYFRLLESSFLSRQPSAAPRSPGNAFESEIYRGVNAGYYERFFVERRLLGRGSFGTVHLCTHVIDEVSLGDFAVKKIPVGDNKDWFRKIIREVKALEALTASPFVVAYKHSWLDVHRHNEFCPYTPFLFILMTFCDKGSLDDKYNDHIRNTQSISEETIWSYLGDLISGLHHLHRAGILHMDVKLSNALLISDPSKRCGERVVLSDFGTAEIMTEIAGRSHSGFTGTVEFTAPEVLSENHEYSEFSEMWSLGIVAYALAYGQLPYTDPDPQICADKIRAHQVLKLPALPERTEELKLLILALTDKDFARRPLTGALLSHPLIRGKIAESYFSVD